MSTRKPGAGAPPKRRMPLDWFDALGALVCAYACAVAFQVLHSGGAVGAYGVVALAMLGFPIVRRLFFFGAPAADATNGQAAGGIRRVCALAGSLIGFGGLVSLVTTARDPREATIQDPAERHKFVEQDEQRRRARTQIDFGLGIAGIVLLRMGGARARRAPNADVAPPTKAA